MVFHGCDKYDNLDELQQEGVTHFKGDSQQCSSIFVCYSALSM